MKATKLPWVLAAAALATMGGVTAHAENRPSFDCRKASNATEKRICADPDLARLDRDLASLWRAMIHSFTDNGQVSEIRADQKQWIAGRNECGDDAHCIASRYREEIDRFQGKDKSYPAAGVFERENIGEAALYPHDGGYLVSIQTADPKNGSWTCEVTGTAKPDGDALRVTAGDASFAVTPKGLQSLMIAPNPEVLAVASKACGLNGTFAFTYTREKSKEKR